MRNTYLVEVSYPEDGGMVIKVFKSLYKCSLFYRVHISNIKRIASGIADCRLDHFPPSVKITLTERKSEKKDNWECPDCHRVYHLCSKNSHLISRKHSKMIEKDKP